MPIVHLLITIQEKETFQLIVLQIENYTITTRYSAKHFTEGFLKRTVPKFLLDFVTNDETLISY